MAHLLKDTLNKGHLCIRDTFLIYTNLYYSGNIFLPPEKNIHLLIGETCEGGGWEVGGCEVGGWEGCGL